VQGEGTRTRGVVLYTLVWWVAGDPSPVGPYLYLSSHRDCPGDNLSLGMSLHPLCCFPLPLLLRHPFPSFISEYSSSLPNTGDPGRAERRLACAVLLLLLVLLDRPGQSIPLTIRFSRFPPVPSRVGPYLPICLSLQSASSLSSDAGTIPRFESLA
jgi:hypothetical protein